MPQMFSEDYFLFAKECPLWVRSRHVQRTSSCPLYPRKRHQMRHMVMSAKGSCVVYPAAALAALNRAVLSAGQ
jgi:hypothetical protein